MLTIATVSGLKTEKVRKDKKPSRSYFSVLFMDSSNPFATGRTRNFFQSYDAKGGLTWKGVSPEAIQGLVGTQCAGKFAGYNVKPYKIGERTVNTYSTVILPHEETNIVATLKGLGHELAPAKVEVIAPVASAEKAQA